MVTAAFRLRVLVDGQLSTSGFARMKSAPSPDGGGGGGGVRLSGVVADADEDADAGAVPPDLDAGEFGWVDACLRSLDAESGVKEEEVRGDATMEAATMAMTPPRKSDAAEDVPYALLSPRSRRKRRNRDQMRLVRRKERVSCALRLEAVRVGEIRRY